MRLSDILTEAESNKTLEEIITSKVNGQKRELVNNIYRDAGPAAYGSSKVKQDVAKLDEFFKNLLSTLDIEAIYEKCKSLAGWDKWDVAKQVEYFYRNPHSNIGYNLMDPIFQFINEPDQEQGISKYSLKNIAHAIGTGIASYYAQQVFEKHPAELQRLRDQSSASRSPSTGGNLDRLRAQQARLDAHQFGSSIGGDASNYRRF